MRAFGHILLKFVLLAVLPAMLGGCFFGDPFHQAYIYVEFPQTDKDEVLPIMLGLADRLGLQRGGRSMVNGKDVFRNCEYVSAPERAACKWVPVEDRDRDSITIWLDERDPIQRYIEASATVKIADSGNGSRVTFEFTSDGYQLRKEYARLYFRIKQALIDQYGGNVTTKDGP